MSIRKLLAGEGNWTHVKEFLGQDLDTEAGKVTLPEKKLQELLTLVDIPATQRRMIQKDLERLVEKLCSIHLAVLGTVVHLFRIQYDMNQGGVERAWMLPAFHSEIADWRALALQVAAWHTHLAEIVHQKPTHLGLCNASGLGAGGVWIEPD